MFATLKLLFVYLFLGVPAALVGVPWSALRGDFSTMYRWGMNIVALGVRAAGIKVFVEGHENIPVGRQCIFMSNHASNLDATVLLPAIPGMASVLIKKELMKIPLLGTAMRMGKYVPVSRGHSREDAVRSVEAAADAMASGLHIMVFPEGTRSPDGNLLPFKKGAFFLASSTAAPIVPVAISGTRSMMRKGSLKIFPGLAKVSFLPAVYPESFTEQGELIAAVRDEINRGLQTGTKVV